MTTHIEPVPTPLTVDGRNLLTHSRTRSWRKCNRRHYYEYERAIRPLTDAKALRMGKSLHLANEEHRKNGRSIEDALALGTADYDTMPPWAETDLDAQDQWLLEGEIMRRLIAGYFWRWPDDHVELIESEKTVVMPIINPDTGAKSTLWELAVKIDAIVRLRDRRLAVMETKTCGEDISKESDYWRQLRIDHQVSIELLGARHIGHDVVTTIYDVIRKPAIKPKLLSKKAKAGILATGIYFDEPTPPSFKDPGKIPERETPAMFGARLRHDIGERPEFYFARMEIPRLEADLVEFRYDLWDQQKAIRAAQQRDLWARNADACTAYGRCPYFDFCSQGRRIMPQDPTPAGFRSLSFVHPELEDDLT